MVFDPHSSDTDIADLAKFDQERSGGYICFAPYPT